MAKLEFKPIGLWLQSLTISMDFYLFEALGNWAYFQLPLKILGQEDLSEWMKYENYITIIDMHYVKMSQRLVLS